MRLTTPGLVSFVIVIAMSVGAGAQDSRPKPPDGAGWKVETSYGPTRELKFTTHEGTWMNLDVSPDGTEIVFDLLGDLYSVPIAGGGARRLTSGTPFDQQPRWSPDGTLITFTSDRGGGDNVWVMNRDGSSPRAVTHETYRLLNGPCFTPDGRFVVAHKHFTSHRSLGSGEMWMYAVAGGGEGVALTTKRNEQQNSAEAELSPDGRFLWFSEDVSPGGAFDYNRDPNGTIYAIFRVDLKTGERTRAVDGQGGAVRPKVSPDGKTLAFVRRVRGKSILMLRELATGAERQLFDGLSKDQQETWAIFGLYPHFAWMPDGASIVVWADGGFRRVSVASGAVTVIPFEAEVEQTLAETVRFRPEAFAETFRVHEVRWPAVAPEGKRVAFQALGRIRVADINPDAAAETRPSRRLTTSEDQEFTPSWAPDGGSIAWVSWNDAHGGAIHVADPDGGRDRVVTDRPGHYANPSFSEDGTALVYERLTGDGFSGRVFGEDPGVWRVSTKGGSSTLVTKTGSRPRFHDGGRRILVQQAEGEGSALVSLSLEGQDRRVVATSARATEYALAPNGRRLAFTELFQAYVCELPSTGRPVAVGPGMKNLPCERISRDAGEFLSWSPDGAVVYHHLASTLSATVVGPLFPAQKPESAPTKGVWERNRLIELGFDAKSDSPDSLIAFTGARVITMRGDEVLEPGIVIVRGRHIEAVGTPAAITIPKEARIIDVAGKTIIPGFVDIHAHLWAGQSGQMPQNWWPYLAHLAFGVTTTHDPSNDTKFVFAASEMQKAGLLLGPHIFSTGTILYGAEGDFKAVVDSLDDARSHLRRMKAHGAFSVKSYNQPRRDQRQQVLQAARELEMNVVPEGGSTLCHNLTMIQDGHTTVEHALPVAPLREDVLRLFSATATGYTPTLIVGYGGIFGENWWYQKTNVWENDRLLRFTPRALVDARSRRRTVAPDSEYNHQDLARSAAELLRRGVHVAIGSHGQLQGLGAHWEIWMMAQGGMTPMEALRVATISGAQSIGLDRSVGSLEAGKLADLLVLDRNPLDDIRNTESILHVMIAGRLHDAMTLAELAPRAGQPPALPELGGLGAGLGGLDTCPDGDDGRD